MTDLLTRAWHALTPEQRPVGMEWTPGGPTAFSDFNPAANGGDSATDYRYLWMWQHAAYDRLCVACERVLHELGCSPYFRAKGQWGGDGLLGADRWSWLHGLTVIDHTCRLTAAVLAIEAMQGGDDER